MKRRIKRMIGLVIALSFIVNLIGVAKVSADESTLTPEQENAIAMLNYITVLTDEINASRNSRVFMEEAYSALINNIFPNSVDGRTLSYMDGLLDTMENYRMISVKRERLQYIYEQSKAKAIRSAIPNPVGMIGVTNAMNPVKLIGAIVYMAVDSYTSYTEYLSSAEQQYLKDGWSLDDEEAGVLHESRKETFSYMVRMVNDYSLPGELTLTEDTVDEFVKWKNDPNVVSRIRFLESNEETYRSYSGYWLLLAESYYNNGDYRECIDAVDKYECMDSKIFRRDYEYAEILPLAIAAAKEIYDIETYAIYAAERVKSIKKNTDNKDWALRYFAAQTLLDLYAETKASYYLNEAYQIVYDNVNNLVKEQQELNAVYLTKVQTKKIPKDVSKEDRKQIKNYNKMLKESREKEMPPVYEPLLLNCELLSAIAREMDISENQKAEINTVLHPNGNTLFLCGPVDDQFWFDQEKGTTSLGQLSYYYGGSVLILPTEFLSDNSEITVTVLKSDGAEPVVFSDWTVDKVQRGNTSDISTFETAYVSKDAQKYSWKQNEKITIEIKPRRGMNMLYRAKLKSQGTKKNWYDYLKIWEGESKNNWLDYLRIWENSVDFVADT